MAEALGAALVRVSAALIRIKVSWCCVFSTFTSVGRRRLAKAKAATEK
jgi:hypothetical protein